MAAVNPAGDSKLIPAEHQIEIRVRYQETDGQGHVHHSNYLNYFEVARAEMLRLGGVSYRELEESGVILVVNQASCNYRTAAKYDDVLTIKTTLVKAKGARIVHRYLITRGQDVICEGETVVASIGTDGKVKRLPGWLCSDGKSG